MRYNGVITLPNLNPEKYLTKDILSKISLAVKGKEKDLDKQAYLLKDGTLIMIERPIAGMTGDGCTLYNPKDICISDKCKVTIVYTIEEQEKTVSFIAESFADLAAKWDNFKSVKGFPPELIGTIDDISLTDDQKTYIIKLEDVTNELLNLLMETDIELGPDDISNLKLTERYNLINFTLTNLSRNLVQYGIAERIHLPYIRRNEYGESVELREHIDRSTYER